MAVCGRVRLDREPADRSGCRSGFSAGIRPVIGPVTLDFGAIYYYYPRERQIVGLTPEDTDYYEGYAKASWAINDTFTVGANFFYSPDWLGTGATEAYASGTAKISLPNDVAVSGELGRIFLGTADYLLPPTPYPDYTYWNAGASWTYEKVLTFDLRYHDTDLSKEECYAITSDPHGFWSGSGRSRWCGATVIGSVSFDTTFTSLGWIK